jgi:acetyltransferase-like isoleucine patch superfamily enzyme
MSFIDRLVLKIKRPQSPAFRALKRALVLIFSQTVPRIPSFLRGPLRVLYELHFIVLNLFRTLYTLFYRGPLFQARCASFGQGVMLEGLPFVSGHVELHVGNTVRLGGNISIMSGAVFKNPRLVLGDRCIVGWNTSISINREVIIEEDAIVSFDCRISDTDGHPRDADLRAARMPPAPNEVLPVRICKKAFVANGTHVMKGVTIGEGAVIGANSVVISNIPPYCLAMGNPAEVFIRNYGRPKPPRKDSTSTHSADA